MPIDVRCPCGFETTVPDEYGGKRGRCKRCGAAIAIPALAQVASDPFAPDSGWAPFPVVADEEEDSGSHIAPVAPKARAAGGEPEPWYYRVLVVYAWIIVGAGVAVAAVLTLILVVGLIIGVATGARLPEPMAILVAPAIPLAVAFVSAVCGAPILLAVDAARTLRSIRAKLG